MKILLLGGTAFLGRHIAELALNREIEITLFNRGKTNPNFLKEADGVTHIHGDRSTNDIKLLTNYWDAVIDTSGREPDDVKRSVEQLKDRCDKYVYISSVSAYSDLSKGPVLEADALHEPNKGGYASNKATCELIVNSEAKNNLIIRPGLIVGPHDPSDRFTYWPWRMSQGGNVVVPNVGQDKNSPFVDVRDLALWILKAIDQDLEGAYNAAGPKKPIRYREFLTTCQKEVSPENTKLHWIDESVLLANEVEPWIGLPFWLPDSLNMGGMMCVNNDKAISAGLRFRPMEETINDTLRWCLAEHTGKWLAGLDKKKEKMLIKTFIDEKKISGHI